METITFPPYYQSTDGPGISQTLTNTALNFLPAVNFVLMSRGVQIMPETLNFWISVGCFLFFSARIAHGYIKAKIKMYRQMGMLKEQLGAALQGQMAGKAA